MINNYNKKHVIKLGIGGDQDVEHPSIGPNSIESTLNQVSTIIIPLIYHSESFNSVAPQLKKLSLLSCFGVSKDASKATQIIKLSNQSKSTKSKSNLSMIKGKFFSTSTENFGSSKSSSRYSTIASNITQATPRKRKSNVVDNKANKRNSWFPIKTKPEEPP